MKENTSTTFNRYSIYVEAVKQYDALDESMFKGFAVVFKISDIAAKTKKFIFESRELRGPTGLFDNPDDALKYGVEKGREKAEEILRQAP